MEKEPSTFQIEVKTSTSTIEQAVVMVTMTIGAFCVGLALLFGMNNLMTHDYSAIPEPEPLSRPMFASYIDWGTYAPVQEMTGEEQVWIYSVGDDHLATIDAGDPYFNDVFTFHRGQTLSRAEALAVELDAPHPASIITLNTDYGQGANICIPASTTTERYYIDANGDAFFDQKLTRPAGTHCGDVKSRALAIQNWQGGTTSDPFDRPTPGTGVLFMKDSVPFGPVGDDGSIGTHFLYDGYVFDTSRSPLAVWIHSDQPVTVEALRARLTTDDGGEVTVCIPETELTESEGAEDGMYDRYYFFDSSGTPYLNIHLTQPALLDTCT